MLYEFVCDKCGKKYERGTNEPFLCECGNMTRRVFTAPFIVVRGGSKDEQITDDILKDFYKGQDEINRGIISKTEIEVGMEGMVKQAERVGKDPAYNVGVPPKLTKEQMKKKADEQRERIEKSLIKYGRK